MEQVKNFVAGSLYLPQPEVYGICQVDWQECLTSGQVGNGARQLELTTDLAADYTDLLGLVGVLSSLLFFSQSGMNNHWRFTRWSMIFCGGNTRL